MSGETQFVVTWQIDEWCAHPVTAAVQARMAQQDRESIADVFMVENVETGEQWKVDLGGSDASEMMQQVREPLDADRGTVERLEAERFPSYAEVRGERFPTPAQARKEHGA